ncbi:MAG TPA: hypothetical protein VFQ77_03005 [Pseudonocardiaceae bacterium]|nr:hypothetical protein [Pseudonocardiaceae bacterium]
MSTDHRDQYRRSDVLLLDYEMAREDERSMTNATATMASVAAALLAGIVAVLIGDCRYRQHGDCYSLPDEVLALTPILPLTVVSFVMALGVIGTVRSFYLRSIEAELRRFYPTPLTNLKGVISPSATELLLTVTSPVRGRLAYRMLLLSVVGGCLLAFAGVTIVIALKVGTPWKIAMILIYGPVFAFILRETYVANMGGRTLFQHALSNLPPEYPGVDVTPRASNRSAVGERSLVGYLLLPRPQDLIKWAFIPIAFFLGILLSPDTALLSFTQVKMDIAVWLAFEYFGYQARYQWNDIRGLTDDIRHPSKVERKRLPTSRWGVATSVALSATVATLRVVLVLLVAFSLPDEYGSLLLIGVIATWVIAVIYEGARSGDGFEPRAPNARAIVIWIIVGGGYAIRAFLGLSLAGAGDQNWPVLALATASAWTFGIVFVTLTWILEAVGHCYSASPATQLYYATSECADGPARLSHKTHLVKLIPYAGLQALPSDNHSDFVHRCDTITPLQGKSPFLAPWNGALILSIGLGAAACVTGTSLVPGGSVVVMSIAGSLVICSARSPRSRLIALIASTAGVLVLACITVPSASISATVIIIIFGAMYWLFRNSSYADLRDFNKNIRSLGRKIRRWFATKAVRLLKLLVGKRTFVVLMSSRTGGRKE